MLYVGFLNLEYLDIDLYNYGIIRVGGKEEVNYIISSKLI